MARHQNYYSKDNTLDREDYLELKHYEQHCSSIGNKIQWSGSKRFYTNCVHPAHNDRNPSLVIKQGDKRVIFSCLSGCDRAELTDYFRSVLGGL
jgi:hypothetical protein